MPDSELPLHAAPPVLTPRQDRIDATIERVLRARGTRSELRTAVYEFADLARLQGVSPERAVAQLKTIAMRAAPMLSIEEYAGDSPADRMAMIVRWCTQRYFRVD